MLAIASAGLADFVGALVVTTEEATIRPVADG